ncbi:hypothetical protein GCL60_15280 [Silvanigrella paludirubra]|uniref:Alpha-xenorhabdolysin family binary toxin subunit A n=1 Tax=Silvanigrella paludirubra TaxID=2499159 RepID=A0A6N6VNG8_9BACT|nr:hypothetical protein [Silvanigrella paludirubra]KAB8036489.1 hypothetical protein GCL60_15280 [Silvanigrella paludirubra]
MLNTSIDTSTIPQNIINLTPKTLSLVPPLSEFISENPMGKYNNSTFCLFSKEWLNLQLFNSRVLMLPIAKESFTDLYGEFKEEYKSEIEDVIKCMKEIRDLSNIFGNPNVLVAQISKNPDILFTDKVPTEIYTHIVWFAGKVYRVANSFTQTYTYLQKEYDRFLSATSDSEKTYIAKRLTLEIKEFMSGPGGLIEKAKSMLKLTSDLIKRLAEFDIVMTEKNERLIAYSNSSSQFLEEARNEYNDDIERIKVLGQAAAAAHKEWEDYTIAATTTSVGLLILTLGIALPISAILGGTLGAKAAEALKMYDKYVADQQNTQVDAAKKARLISDLEYFNLVENDTKNACSRFVVQLKKVEGAWLQIYGDLKHIAESTDYQPENLDQISIMFQNLLLTEAYNDWQSIKEKASEYTQNSLINFLPPVKLGSPIPQNA